MHPTALTKKRNQKPVWRNQGKKDSTASTASTSSMASITSNDSAGSYNIVDRRRSSVYVYDA